MVVHACDPSTLRGWLEDHKFEPNLANVVI